MYDLLLSVHNFVRWFFLAAMAYALFSAIKGMLGALTYTKSDKTASTFLVASAHSQLLLGLILWFTSPNVEMARANFNLAMKDANLRLQLLEHPLLMIIAVVLIQVGSIQIKKAYADADKHKRAIIFFGIALVLVLSRIPWSSTPLFRF